MFSCNWIIDTENKLNKFYLALDLIVWKGSLIYLFSFLVRLCFGQTNVEKRYVGPTHDYWFSNSLMNSLAWRYRADLEIQGGQAYKNIGT